MMTLGTPLEPTSSHFGQEFHRCRRKTRSVTYHSVDAASWAKRCPVIVNPLFNLGGLESFAAMETATVCARLDISSIIGGMFMRLN
ncbi:hypothetical protein [Rhizobium sp. N122]|uniref:hypothetical protein n=1 Tax=Rhizobium sp. N122 TaxID=1764272 RepID=UPI00167EFE89|nr:hypothetical protein [Rhizobium sp. N122]